MRIDYTETVEGEVDREFTNVINYYDLQEDFFTWHSKYNCKTQIISGDKQSGYKDVLRNWTITAKRNNIVAVEKCLYVQDDCSFYRVEISILGKANDAYAVIPKRKESVANKFFKVFEAYIKGESLENIQLIWDEE